MPGVDASTNVSGETHSALPVVSITWMKVTPFCCSRAGSTWTCNWRSRCPQIATFATPGTPVSRGLIVHRARTDSSINESSSDERPIIITRLVEDNGCSISGGCDTFGRACAWVRRSGDDLPGLLHVGARLEDKLDGGQSGDRLRTDLVQPRDAIEEVGLHRDRDQLLHLGGGESERLRLDLDHRWAELRQQVDLRVPKLDDTGEHEARRDRDHEQSEREACPHGGADHLAPRVPTRSGRGRHS